MSEIKTSKNLILIILILVIIVDIVLRLTTILGDADSRETGGDYTIVFNPNVRVDTFLLNKKNGKIWKNVTYIDVEGDPRVWVYMDRLDSKEDINNFALTSILKKTRK